MFFHVLLAGTFVLGLRTKKTLNFKKHVENPGFSSSETNVTTSPKNNFEF